MPQTNTSAPLMSDTRMDYPNSAYFAVVSRGSDQNSMEIMHAVRGDSLVANMLEASEAAFAAEVSAPYATYRKTEVSENIDGKLSVEQTVSWESNKIIQPVYIRPLVIATQKKKITLSADSDGVHSLWDKQTVTLLPGTILAIDKFWRSKSTMESLLRLVKDETLLPGTYRVDESTSEGFHFKVKAHPDLFGFLANPDDRTDHRDAILVGALAAGFEILRRKYSANEEDAGEGGYDWRGFPTLRALHMHLVIEGITPWDEEDFCAEQAATMLRPLQFPGGTDD